jgi:hypothetical protein
MPVFFRILFSLIICTLIIACGDENPSSAPDKEKCKYGSPTPIFTKELEKVIDHSFSVKGQKGVENVKFENGTQLELLQSGCNELLQSYQFAMSDDLNGDDAFWIGRAGEQFRYLSTLSENHFSFSLWADVIGKAAEFTSLGETFEPEPGTFIKIDKIPSAGKTILVVTFEAKR